MTIVITVFQTCGHSLFVALRKMGIFSISAFHMQYYSTRSFWILVYKRNVIIDSVINYNSCSFRSCSQHICLHKAPESWSLVSRHILFENKWGNFFIIHNFCCFQYGQNLLHLLHYSYFPCVIWVPIVSKEEKWSLLWRCTLVSSLKMDDFALF